MPLDQEAINQQLTLLVQHRRTLAHLLEQAAAYGGVILAPPQVAAGIAEAREEIARIKGALREGGVEVENEPNDEAQPQDDVKQTAGAGLLVQSTVTVQDNSGTVVGAQFNQPNWAVTGNITNVAGDQRTINTQGGDYAEGNIDKRQGTFVSGGIFYGPINSQAEQQSGGFIEDDYRALLAEVWSRAQNGKLKFADTERVRAALSRSGLTSEQARVVEHQIRAGLADEQLWAIPQSAFECRMAGTFLQTDGPRLTGFSHFVGDRDALAHIAQAVLLDEQTALQVLIQRISRQCPPDVKRLREALPRANNALPGTEEFATLERFLTNLEAALTGRE